MIIVPWISGLFVILSFILATYAATRQPPTEHTLPLAALAIAHGAIFRAVESGLEFLFWFQVAMAFVAAPYIFSLLKTTRNTRRPDSSTEDDDNGYDHRMEESEQTEY